MLRTPLVGGEEQKKTEYPTLLKGSSSVDITIETSSKTL